MCVRYVQRIIVDHVAGDLENESRISITLLGNSQNISKTRRFGVQVSGVSALPLELPQQAG
jgi:hypothetical protein